MSEDQMSHVPAPESTPDASEPESGPVGDRDAQDAREARYAEAVLADGTASTEAQRIIRVADAEMAPLVARVAELEAEVERQAGWATFWCDKARAVEAAVKRWEDDAQTCREADNDRDYHFAHGLEQAVEQARAALAAAGPAVMAAPRQADATLRAKLLDLHVECRMGMCGEPSGFCHQCDNDWPCDTVEYVRLFSAAPAVSDGEGATSEAVCEDCARGRCVHACEQTPTCPSSAHHPTCPVRRASDRALRRIEEERS